MTAQQTKILNTQILHITAGPSRDALLNALATKDSRVNRAGMTSDEGHLMELQVMGLEYANGKRGEEWKVTGCALEPRGTVTVRNWRSFQAHFHTDSRRGTFKFVD